MTKSEQMDHIRQIRSIMERSVKFISLSGLSGVATGVVAIVAAGLVVKRLGNSLLTPHALSSIAQNHETKACFLLLRIRRFDLGGRIRCIERSLRHHHVHEV